MTWIKTIPYSSSTGILKKYYDRVKSPDGQIDNILQAHSLRPHSLNGHMTLYKNVLHHQSNTLPKWYLEAIGTYVSMLNNCDYCVQHHFHGLKKLLDDDEKAEKIYTGFTTKNISSVFDEKYKAGLAYAEKLTIQPAEIKEENIQYLKNVGFNDGEILEINQVTSYFNYANRTVLGLGVMTGDEKLGLSPNDDGDEKNWGHG